jgi:hypothetical protein
MVRTGMVLSLALLALGATLACAAENSQITELRQEIKVLQAQREQALKGIHAYYDAIINRDKRTEKERRQIRNTLEVQERQALNATRTHEERALKRVHEHYEFLIHLDRHNENEMRAIRAAVHRQEAELLSLAANDADRQRIRAWYDYQRRVLTHDIHVDEHVISELHSRERAHADHIRSAYAAARHQIHEQFGHLIAYWTKETRLEGQELHHLRELEREHIHHVRTVFDTKIKELEHAIHLLEHQGKGHPQGHPQNNPKTTPPKKR